MMLEVVIIIESIGKNETLASDRGAGMMFTDENDCTSCIVYESMGLAMREEGIYLVVQRMINQDLTW